MRAILRAAIIATSAAGCAGVAFGQSSNPFSGLFGGGSQSDSPVSLTVTVPGNTDLEDDIRRSSLISGALSEDRTTGQDVLAAARSDYARILGEMYDKGYYSTRIFITLDGVEAAEIAPLDAPAVVRNVVVTVDTGPEFRFSRAAIAPVAPRTDLPDGYRQGEPAGSGIIKQTAASAVTGWREASHAKAEVASQQITADHPRAAVDSQIGINPGPPVTFGRLNMRGYDRMIPRRLHKIAGLPEGERFDPDEVEDVRKRLRRSGVFSAITLEEAETLNPDNSMDINLTVVEQKLRRIGTGFEISTTDGAQVSAYWMHRNLLGGGERLRIDGRIKDIGSDTSGRDEELTLRLERPATVTPDTTAYVETGVSRMREEDYKADTGRIGLGFNQIFSDRLTTDIAIQYQFSRVYDDLGETDFKVLAFPMNVMWDRRDDINDAKSGYYLNAGATPFKGFEDTDSGVRLLGEARGYYSLGEDDRFTFAGRARIGSVLGAEIQNTPRDYLFFSGGGGTVRGQPYQSLGVEEITSPNNTTIKTGGMSVANLNAELRWQVRENIGVVAFADWGQVWTEESWGGDSGSHAGAGLGIRYRTPIGPLRFDVAGPVSGDTGEGVQLYLGLGQAF